MEKPNFEKITKEDKDNYLEILKETGPTVKLNKKGGLTAIAPSSIKYRKIIIKLREEKKRQKQEELETLGQDA